ncbi:hypothetical protein A6R68_02599 [Neotoma lepida]|uniref:Uncharacterized protein n=1 Tax=Neotoma lepida TaxID=56216 RepID=A0A1A6GRQ3_NEOLE|nr:hypothetical protein A6R68_02599 [Neotoma lepida]
MGKRKKKMMMKKIMMMNNLGPDSQDLMASLMPLPGAGRKRLSSKGQHLIGTKGGEKTLPEILIYKVATTAHYWSQSMR